MTRSDKIDRDVRGIESRIEILERAARRDADDRAKILFALGLSPSLTDDDLIALRDAARAKAGGR